MANAYSRLSDAMKGKVMIITGASSGIGRALAVEAAQRKLRLVLAARNVEKLNQLAEELQLPASDLLIVKTDVSIEADCKDLIDKTLQKFQSIDILVNNAGISMRALFAQTSLEVIKQLMDINFWGTVYCTKYALDSLLQAKGSVVGISSIAGYKGLPGRTGYSASKFAMQGFLESLRIENLKNELHVLIACPGFTRSNIRNTALGPDGSMQGDSPRDENSMMSAEEVANHILKAIEKRKRTLILTRQGKLTIFLNKIIPGRLDRMVFKHMSKETDSPF
jgi:dehydrogenase/reductase SDR family member 7B